jgi:hypothetical protein
VVHWAYGTAWEAMGAMLRMAIPQPAATATHLADGLGHGSGDVAGTRRGSSATGVGAKEVAIDVFHHLVYAGAFAGGAGVSRGLVEAVLWGSTK